MHHTITKKFIVFLTFCLTQSVSAEIFQTLEQAIEASSRENNENKENVQKNQIPHKVPTRLRKIKEVKLTKNKKGNYQVSWNILREYNLKSKKLGKNLKKVINKNIAISGFMLPLDYSAKHIKEFLLLPYIPNCAHVPPPPPNMVIIAKVVGNKKIKPSYWPVEIEGKLEIGSVKKLKNDPYIPGGVYNINITNIKELKQ